MAGLQDFVWGFGIRNALESAALAARCWLAGVSYPERARDELCVPNRAAPINRLLWDTTAAVGLDAYALMLRYGWDPRRVLRLVMRVGFMAMGLAMRGLLSIGSLIALAALVWILYRAYKKRWDL